jgi:hypothetical protein
LLTYQALLQGRKCCLALHRKLYAGGARGAISCVHVELYVEVSMGSA